jgi:hypothetical protein
MLFVIFVSSSRDVATSPHRSTNKPASPSKESLNHIAYYDACSPNVERRLPEQSRGDLVNYLADFNENWLRAWSMVVGRRGCFRSRPYCFRMSFIVRALSFQRRSASTSQRPIGSRRQHHLRIPPLHLRVRYRILLWVAESNRTKCRYGTTPFRIILWVLW